MAAGFRPIYRPIQQGDPFLAFDRLPVVRQRLGGVGHTKVYDDIGKGLFPPPLKLGGGARVCMAAARGRCHRRGDPGGQRR